MLVRTISNFHVLFDQLKHLASLGGPVFGQKANTEWVDINPEINDFPIFLILLDLAEPSECNLNPVVARMVKDGNAVRNEMIIIGAGVGNLWDSENIYCHDFGG